MKILLDECVPRPTAKFLAEHAVSTVQVMGWGAFKNGALLNLADGSFDLFLTSDQNLRYQQNFIGRRIAILELSTNNWLVIKANVESHCGGRDGYTIGRIRCAQISRIELIS